MFQIIPEIFWKTFWKKWKRLTLWIPELTLFEQEHEFVLGGAWLHRILIAPEYEFETMQKVQQFCRDYDFEVYAISETSPVSKQTQAERFFKTLRQPRSKLVAEYHPLTNVLIVQVGIFDARFCLTCSSHNSIEQWMENKFGLEHEKIFLQQNNRPKIKQIERCSSETEVLSDNDEWETKEECKQKSAREEISWSLWVSSWILQHATYHQITYWNEKVVSFDRLFRTAHIQKYSFIPSLQLDSIQNAFLNYNLSPISVHYPFPASTFKQKRVSFAKKIPSVLILQWSLQFSVNNQLQIQKNKQHIDYLLLPNQALEQLQFETPEVKTPWKTRLKSLSNISPNQHVVWLPSLHPNWTKSKPLQSSQTIKCTDVGNCKQTMSCALSQLETVLGLLPYVDLFAYASLLPPLLAHCIDRSFSLNIHFACVLRCQSTPDGSRISISHQRTSFILPFEFTRLNTFYPKSVIGLWLQGKFLVPCYKTNQSLLSYFENDPHKKESISTWSQKKDRYTSIENSLHPSMSWFYLNAIYQEYEKMSYLREIFQDNELQSVYERLRPNPKPVESKESKQQQQQQSSSDLVQILCQCGEILLVPFNDIALTLPRYLGRIYETCQKKTLSLPEIPRLVLLWLIQSSRRASTSNVFWAQEYFVSKFVHWFYQNPATSHLGPAYCISFFILYEHILVEQLQTTFTPPLLLQNRWNEWQQMRWLLQLSSLFSFVESE